MFATLNTTLKTLRAIAIDLSQSCARYQLNVQDPPVASFHKYYMISALRLHMYGGKVNRRKTQKAEGSRGITKCRARGLSCGKIYFKF